MCKLFKMRKTKNTKIDLKIENTGFSLTPKSGSTKLIEK